MRILFALLVVKLAVLAPSVAADDPLSRSGDLRQVAVFYACDEAVLRAEWRLENGRYGNELGACNVVGAAAVGNTCLPERSLQFARFALAWNWQLNRWVLDSDARREAFCKSFAARYHAGGLGKTPEERAMNNETYARDLLKILAREQRYVTMRDAVEGWKP